MRDLSPIKNVSIRQVINNEYIACEECNQVSLHIFPGRQDCAAILNFGYVENSLKIIFLEKILQGILIGVVSMAPYIHKWSIKLEKMQWSK